MGFGGAYRDAKWPSVRFDNELLGKDSTVGADVAAMIKGLETHDAALVKAAADGFHANAADVSGNNVPLNGGTYNTDGTTVADALSTATGPLPPAPVSPLTPQAPAAAPAVPGTPATPGTPAASGDDDDHPAAGHPAAAHQAAAPRVEAARAEAAAPRARAASNRTSSRRLALEIPLGPSNPYQQYTAQAAVAGTAVYRTRVSIAPPARRRARRR